MASITITTAVISTNQTISTYKANNTAQLNTNNAFVNTLQPNNLDYKTHLIAVNKKYDSYIKKPTEVLTSDAMQYAAIATEIIPPLKIVSTPIKIVAGVGDAVGNLDTVSRLLNGKSVPEIIKDSGVMNWPGSIDSYIYVENDTKKEALDVLSAYGLDENNSYIQENKYNNKTTYSFAITGVIEPLNDTNPNVPILKYNASEKNMEDLSKYLNNDSLIYKETVAIEHNEDKNLANIINKGFNGEDGKTVVIAPIYKDNSLDYNKFIKRTWGKH